jgi:uncharacterized membrane protein
MRVRPSELVRGPKGHPSHPPLTGATIGAFVTASSLGAASALGLAATETAVSWWLALLVGLFLTVPTAITGLADWVGLDRRSALRRTGSAHLVAMGSSTVAFLLAAVVGYDGYRREVVTSTALGLTLIGLGLLILGGRLGGSLVFVHGMRVADEPARSADDS